MVEAKIDPEKKVLFLLIFVALVAGIYGTYAYFSAQSTSDEQSVTTGTMKLSFDDSTPIVNAENIIPIGESTILTKATKKSFSITNTGDYDATVTILLTPTEITENLKSLDFKWALYENGTKIAENTFLNSVVNTPIILKNNITLTVGATKSYELYIWINETGSPQDELQNGKLSATINATAVQ